MNNSVHFPDHSSLSDQASQLRELVERSRHDGQLRPAPLATAIMVTGGKGGIGKSSLALNLAIALARLGSRICLLDASLGLGHLDLMCGLNGYWNLGHVLAGSRQLSDIMLDGPAGIHIVPGPAGWPTPTAVPIASGPTFDANWQLWNPNMTSCSSTPETDFTRSPVAALRPPTRYCS